MVSLNSLYTIFLKFSSLRIIMAMFCSVSLMFPLRSSASLFCQSSSGSEENSCTASSCLSFASVFFTSSSADTKSCMALKDGSFPGSVPSAALASLSPEFMKPYHIKRIHQLSAAWVCCMMRVYKQVIVDHDSGSRIRWDIIVSSGDCP